DFQAENAGRYYVDVMLNGCIAEQASTVVEMISVPDFQVSYTGSDVLCPPDTNVLNVVPNDPNFTYTWAERTLGNTGDVGPSTTVSSTGDYYVKAQYNPNPACVPVETEDVTLTFSTPPVADFSVPLTACTDQVLSFVNQSTGDPSLDKFYNWTFGDTQTATDESP